MTIQIFNTNIRTDKLHEISNYHCVYVNDMMHSYSTIMQTSIVDEQSFPIEIPSHQKLQNDSYICWLRLKLLSMLSHETELAK